MDMRRIGAVILAGGAATRFGGRDKPALPVAGTPMLDRVLAAVEGARARVVVGPPRPGLPPDVVCVREQPPGGGPVAAAAAGLAALTAVEAEAGRDGTAPAPGGAPLAGPHVDPATLTTADGEAGDAGGAALDAGGRVTEAVEFVALLAADLPYLTGAAVEALADAVEAGSADGAVYVDDTERRQLLCGVWRTGALLQALGALGDPAGRSMRALVGELEVIECRAAASATPPWYDCDTEEDLRRAQQRHLLTGEGR